MLNATVKRSKSPCTIPGGRASRRAKQSGSDGASPSRDHERPFSSDIDSLSNFKRNTPEFLRQLKETGQPVVLTINGKAELVVQDTASYQRLIELAGRAERMDALEASLDDMKAGRIAPAADVLAEMRQILERKPGR